MTVAQAPSALLGWGADDHAAALRAYALTADILPSDWPRPAPGVDGRYFFEAHFHVPTVGRDALLTGYYEPELPGSPVRTDRFTHALYGPPSDLEPGRTWHDRQAIEEGNLLAGYELAWVEGALEAFLAQVQGSVRVRLPGGQGLRLGFAGKNGHPYTSIGKELIRRGALDEANASVAAIRDWARDHPDQVPGVLRMNRSFVFFRPLDLPDDTGPLGTLQRPVTALRSLAVDPDHIPLGAPVWVEWEGQARLMIAQDTGSAIRGAGRGDIFFGTGTDAGERAGALKTGGRLSLLVPDRRPR
jgi:membrane-bound lytic murein transglycosylase A